MDLTCRTKRCKSWFNNKNLWGIFCHFLCVCVLHLVISPPPPRRSAMSRPSSACVLTPPLVVMVTSLFPTSQVILRPPANRNSAIGDLRGQGEAKVICALSPNCVSKTSSLSTAKQQRFKKIKIKTKSMPTSWAVQRSWKTHNVPSCPDRSQWAPGGPSSAPRLPESLHFHQRSPDCRWWLRCASYRRNTTEVRGVRGGHTGYWYIHTCNQCTQTHASSGYTGEIRQTDHHKNHTNKTMHRFLSTSQATRAFI